MRDLFRFLFRQRNNLLFLALMGISMSLLISGNMHQRAQAISSSNSVIGQIYTWRHDLTEFTDLRAINQQLAQELAEERTRNHSSANITDSVKLRVDTTRKEAYKFITAQVINSTAHKERNYLTLDRGTLDGIHPDLGVVGMNGIVGIVRDASPHFSLVTSILGNEIEPAVVLSRTGHYGLLKWDTDDPATASMVDVAKYVPVQVGDPVVTRGGDHVFPAGFPVGTVIAVHDDPGSNFHSITIKLAEDLTRSGYVHIVFDLLGNERDSLEAKIRSAMIDTVRANVLRFILLVLLQALVIDHIDLAHGWVVPYIYVLFILLLPFDTPDWATLLLGFLIGMTMDLFSSTPGMHASACVVMAYARIWMLRALVPREGYDPGKRPIIQHMGLAWFTTYAGVLILIHHLWLFFVEVYRFDDFFSTFLRALMSAIATFILCLLAQALLSRDIRTR